MKIETLWKYGGLSLILGSTLLTAYSVLFITLLPYKEMRQDMTLAVMDPSWVPIAFVAFFGVVFMIFGFMAVYSKIHQESGVIGLLGFILIETAYLLQACKVTWEICLYPVITGNQGAIALLRDHLIKNSQLGQVFNLAARSTVLLGITLFCLALFRSREFPKSAGILIFAGAILYGLGPLLAIPVAISGIAILSAGCYIAGIKLIRGDLSA